MLSLTRGTRARRSVGFWHAGFMRGDARNSDTRNAFSFKSHIHREHTTWALTITPQALRSAGALSADLQALVIQVLHVPDTPRPVRSRVSHAPARPTYACTGRARPTCWTRIPSSFSLLLGPQCTAPLVNRRYIARLADNLHIEAGNHRPTLPAGDQR